MAPLGSIYGCAGFPMKLRWIPHEAALGSPFKLRWAPIKAATAVPLFSLQLVQPDAIGSFFSR